ncbi:MAG: beta-lactamase family protein [Deltaproteobacteria bacterium]|nr:beta-lactamase family protein [Deltaproteobacteria bacterium]
MPDRWRPLEQLLKDGLTQGVYTAAVALAGWQGELKCQAAAGRVSRDFAAPAATLETSFDLASLTKPLATAASLMVLTGAGKLDPNAALGEFLPAQWLPLDKRPLTLAQLLAHRSGLPAWLPFYQEILQAPPEDKSILLPKLAAAEPLIHPPDTATLYSDLGFMLLQAVVEAVSESTLDRFCAEKIYRPLGLKTLGFMPIHRRGAPVCAPWEGGQVGPPLQYAVTEPGLIPGRRACGEVHDENAWAAGGVAGHAGLFGKGREVFTLLAVLYRAYQGEAGLPFSPAAVRRFLTPVAPGGRALGFDVPDAIAAQCSAGRCFSPRSVGHLGFTGTSFWLDLDLGQMVVLLTNRVHLGRDDKARIRAFRPRFHEAASRALGFDKIFRK